MTQCGRWVARRGARWLARAVASEGDSRGIALLTALFVMFAVVMLLVAFESLMQSEIQFAGLGRNSTLAFNLAEGGIQEALSSARLQGAVPGGTSFLNSLARTAGGGSGTVAYEACVVGFCLGSPTIFPILSTATFAGVPRKVRVLEQAAFQPGFGNIVFGPSLDFQGDASQFTGDMYATGDTAGSGAPGGITFPSYAKSPQCASPTMGKTLLPPEVISGTTIVLGNGKGGGKTVNTNCPDGLTVNDNGTYTWECSNQSRSELAPTSCPGAQKVVPANWHPIAPIGMPSADFAAIINVNPITRLRAGLLSAQATQNGIGVTYTPAGTYTPSYWRGPPPGPVLVVLALTPFCVNANVATPLLKVGPPYPGTCPQGYTYYGASLNAKTALATRYIDWGLVQDDLSRKQATLFFQAPTTLPDAASFQCPGSSGNQCGIRYVPALPQIDVVAQACTATAFDQVNTQDGAPCPGTVTPPGDVTFTGTRTSPETLVIDNTGPQPKSTLQVRFSIPGTGIPPKDPCSQVNFNNFNFGVILVRGNVVLTGNPVFSGYLYATGTITTQGTVTVRGGIFAANLQGQSGAVDAVDPTGTVNFCAGEAANLPLSTQLFTFKQLAWLEVPLNQP